MANKLVIMSIYTHNRVSVVNLDNKMLNIDKKTIKKNEKKTDKQFFHKKVFYWNKNPKNKKHVFFFTTLREIPSETNTLL